MTFAPADYGDLAAALAGTGRKANPYETRRKYGYSLLQQGSDTSPVQSPWQGAARLAQALAGGWAIGNADKEEAAADKKRSDALAQAMAEPDPQKRIGLLAAFDPDKGATAAGQLAIEQYKQGANRQMLEAGARGFGGSFGAAGGPTPLGANANAIAGIESQGQPNNGYGAVGPVADAKGSRALGKYQVMDYNVGPWTQEILGKAMTPQEFLANPEAQNKVFEAKFGQYVTQYGSPQAASRAWFAGPGGMNNPNARDVNGMTTARYEQKFNQNLPPESPDALPLQQPPAGVQPGGLQIDMPGPRGAAPPIAGGQGGGDPALIGQPPPATAQNVSGPSVVAPPAVPDVPRPQPTPQQLQQYQQRIMSGEFGQGPDAISRARAALDADIDRQWNVDRDRRKMEYTQQFSDYEASRKQQMEQPQQAFGNENKLRDEYNTSPVTKAYREVVPIMESVKEAINRPTRAADLNLVYGLGKMMDPNSVVREGEMVMVKNTGTIGDTLAGLIGQLNGGASLQPETRRKIVEEMASRFRGLESSHDAIAGHYTEMAKRYGLNPENVVVPVRRPGKPAEGGGETQKEIVIGLDGKPR